MSFDAITLDTNIFTQRGYNFQEPLLLRLEQFKRTSPIDFILTDVVLNEIFAHIKDKNIETISTYKGRAKRYKESIQNMVGMGFIPLETEKKITKFDEKILISEEDISKYSKNLITDFLKRTKCKKISSDKISVKSILNQYFFKKPPFGETKKKSEFPDAIALNALNDWAKINKKYILAVSDDNDWDEYAKESKYIHVVKKIEDAFSMLNEISLKSSENLETFLKGISRKIPKKLSSKIFSQINSFFDKNLNSFFAITDNDNWDTVVDNIYNIEPIDLVFINNSDYKIISINKDSIDVQLDIVVKVNVKANFIFFKIINGEGDFKSEDEADSEIIYDLKSKIILNLTGDFKNSSKGVKINSIEISDVEKYIDFRIVN